LGAGAGETGARPQNRHLNFRTGSMAGGFPTEVLGYDVRRYSKFDFRFLILDFKQKSPANITGA
jgi:hypothetical protein